MIDTILNLGANRSVIAALAEQTQDDRFALDTWSRFCRMYAASVLSIPTEILGRSPSLDASVAVLRADIEAVLSLCARRGTSIPDQPRAQLRGAIETVFRSCQSERPRIYCEREGITQDTGL